MIMFKVYVVVVFVIVGAEAVASASGAQVRPICAICDRFGSFRDNNNNGNRAV